MGRKSVAQSSWPAGRWGSDPGVSPRSEAVVTSAFGRQSPKRIVVVRRVAVSSSERSMSGGRPVTGVEVAVTDRVWYAHAGRGSAAMKKSVWAVAVICEAPAARS